jgi:hypothetical protein
VFSDVLTKFIKIRGEFGETILKKLNETTIIKKNYEYFLIKPFENKKTVINTLSCLDGGDLLANSKGPRFKLTKKNLDAHYIIEHKEGIEIINKTRNWFNFFDANYDLNMSDYESLLKTFNSNTFLPRNKDFSRVIFLDLTAKDDFIKLNENNPLYSHLMKLKKNFEYLKKIGDQLKKKKKISKIPVWFCFYFKEKDNSISFSLANSVNWFRTSNSLLSK